MQTKAEKISYAATIVALAYFEMQSVSKSLQIKYYKDAAMLGMIEGFQKNVVGPSQNDKLDLKTVQSLSEGIIQDLLKTELDDLYRRALAKIKYKDNSLKENPESAMKLGQIRKNIEKKNRLNFLSNVDSGWIDFVQSTEAISDTITATGVISAYKSGELIGSIIAYSVHHIPLIKEEFASATKAKPLHSIYCISGIMKSFSSIVNSTAGLVPNTLSDVLELAFNSLSMIGIGLVESSIPISKTKSLTSKENDVLGNGILSTGINVVKDIRAIYDFQSKTIEKVDIELQKGFTEAIKKNPGLAKKVSKLTNYHSSFDVIDKKVSALKSSITASILYYSYQVGKSLGNLSQISNHLPSSGFC